jgi:Holliday junction resolvasome RuvABC endonuclease subunit
MALKKKKVGPEDALILGVDPSLNGSGFLVMKNDKIIDHFFFSQVIKTVNASDGHGMLNKSDGVERLLVIQNFFNELLDNYNFDYAAIEDYAYGAKSNSTFQIGGIGEMFRLNLYTTGIPYREYEPTKVKKYATGNGTAEKSAMVVEAYKNGFDVSAYGKSGEDLADAYWISRMLSTELKLHKDKSYGSNLTKHRLEVFTGVSKAYPIPIINRPFISRKGV